MWILQCIIIVPAQKHGAQGTGIIITPSKISVKTSQQLLHYYFIQAVPLHTKLPPEASWLEGERRETNTSWGTAQRPGDVSAPIHPFLYKHALHSYRAANSLYVKYHVKSNFYFVTYDKNKHVSIYISCDTTGKIFVLKVKKP